MLITLEILKEKQACKPALECFIKNFGESAELETILKKINSDKNNNYAFWLARDFKLSGEYKSWYENGNQLEISNFKNGKPCGKHESWHANGQQWEISNYENGELHGKFESWYENGTPWKICSYENGVKI